MFYVLLLFPVKVNWERQRCSPVESATESGMAMCVSGCLYLENEPAVKLTQIPSELRAEDDDANAVLVNGIHNGGSLQSAQLAQ